MMSAVLALSSVLSLTPTLLGGLSPRLPLQMPRASVTGMVASVSSPESLSEALSAALVKDRAVASEMDVDRRFMSQMMMAKDAARVVAELDVIDMRLEMQQMALAKEAATIAADMHASQASMLARQNDDLTTRLRRTTPGYYGRIMPFTYSLAHCVAHGRDAVVAARRDFFFERERVVDRVKTAIKDVAFKLFVLQVRLALRASRKLASWKASWKTRQAMWRERSQSGAFLWVP